MDKGLTLSWRIGLMQWETDEAFERLIKLLQKHQSVVDQVCLFDTNTHHLYIPLDIYGHRMELAAQRLGSFREAGIRSTGINVLCTIGHLNEAWSYMPALPFQAMVGHDGSVSTGCACPNTPEMRAYVREKYEIAACTRPDFIWVDDDIRMHHHGVAWGCFCQTCLDMFGNRTGEAFRREELVKAFDDPARTKLRELWVEQNIESIESLLAEVGKTVRRINPQIELGLMTAGAGWTTYSGQAFDRWFTALGASMARPGGGFYSDTVPIEMFGKALECGFQRAILPANVTDVQYELENFPYQRLKKAAKTIVNECSLALAYGMNGIAFNMLGMPTAHEDILPWIQNLPSARPMWDHWVDQTAGMPTCGLWPAWTNELMALRTVRSGEDWLCYDSRYDTTRPKVLGEIGLPLASEPSGCGTVLCARTAEAFSDSKLKEMLSGGVIMDSTALGVLSERGFGNLTGVRLARRLDNGLLERFTNDALNGDARGKIRDAHIEFWGDGTGMGDVLEPTAKGTRILTTMEDYLNHPQGPGMTAFENASGGRIVVMGYAPWIFLHSVSKRLQLQNVADWISGNTIPVRIDEIAPLIPVTRISADRRRGAVMILNAGMDLIPKATVHIRAAARRASLNAIGQAERELDIRPEAFGGGSITLHDIEPWSLQMLLLQ